MASASQHSLKDSGWSLPSLLKADHPQTACFALHRLKGGVQWNRTAAGHGLGAPALNSSIQRS